MTSSGQTSFTFRASPNLALVKYWGKSDRRRNLPATSSLGITLGELKTVTTVRINDRRDRVVIGEKESGIARFAGFFDALRNHYGAQGYFSAKSRNSFPTAAGLASSSSGFAALSCACAAAAGLTLSSKDLSALARVGSASAARSLFGGFVSLEADALHANQLFGENHWPEIRVIIAAVKSTPKEVTSRKAMELSRTTSPYYASWVSSSRGLYTDCVRALESRDIEKLGAIIRMSYLRMFATMFSSNPPVFYWLPDSLRLLALCQQLRQSGIPAWETMDAGPQVKIICLAPDVGEITARISHMSDEWLIMTSQPGPAPGPATWEPE